jgi:SNF2 family DNA or RNA helicase
MKLSAYTWPRPPGLTPFEHQKTTSEFLISNKKAFCFNEQGTGKTASVIWAADYLMHVGVIRRVLIVCPLSIMKSAWQNDLFKFAMHRKVAVAYHNDSTRRKEIVNKHMAEFVITNFEGVAIIKEQIIDGGFDLIVIDEASAYKNVQTERWKTLRGLQAHIKGLWMLTGTPAAQSPVDAFGLARLINPTTVPKFVTHFKDQVMVQVSQYKWKPRPEATNIVHNVLQPAIRFEKRDCIDLPPVTYVDRDAPLTPQQSKYYEKLKKDMLLQTDGEEISAVNAGAMLNKLLQISGGAVYTDTKEVIEFDVTSRLKVVHEVVEETSNKVLVFVPFTHTIELLEKYLLSKSISCSVINGSVPVSKRDEIVRDFQSTGNIKVLIIQPKAASHGLTLTEADTIVWYAPCNSVETYLQANARIDRPGQVNKMTVVHITGSPVESKVYWLLRNNINIHEKTVDLFKEVIDNKI